jgi:membrane associated rhomboid family serine protease
LSRFRYDAETMKSLPTVTRTLLWINIGVFGLQALLGPALYGPFALWPPASPRFPNAPDFQVWQLLTYGFMHGGLAHLFFNMFALYMFGPAIETRLGAQRFLAYYLACVAGAALLQLWVGRGAEAYPVPTVGASGGVFGLLLAFGMFYPHQKLMLLFPPIPMPAWLFVTLYGLLELYLGVSGRGLSGAAGSGGIAHFAHVGGLLTGFLLLNYWRRRGRA